MLKNIDTAHCDSPWLIIVLREGSLLHATSVIPRYFELDVTYLWLWLFGAWTLDSNLDSDLTTDTYRVMNLMFGTGDRRTGVEMSNECEEVVLFPLFDHHIVTYHTRQLKVITHDHKPWLMLYFGLITHSHYTLHIYVKNYLNIDHIHIIGLKAPTSRELDNANPTAFFGHFLLPHLYLSLEKLQCLLVRDKGRQHDQGTHTWIYETIDRTVSTGALNVIFI